MNADGRSTSHGPVERPYAIVKMGGSLVTDRKRPSTVAETDLARLAKEILEVGLSMVMVHGLGSYGKPILAEAGHSSDFFAIDELPVAVAFEQSAARLGVCVVDAFLKAGAPALGLSPSAVFTATDGAVSVGNLAPIVACLARGIVPVVRGGLLFDSLRGMVACSSDDFVAALALSFGPEIVVFATDVEGVYSEWPPSGAARALEHISRLANHLTSGHAAGEVLPASSAMYSKVERGLEAAGAAGECRIVDGRVPGRLAAALRGKPTPGTVLKNAAVR